MPSVLAPAGNWTVAPIPMQVISIRKRTNRHAYIEDTMTYGKWKIVPGVRYDDNSEFGDHHTPRIAFQYDANDKVSFFANWGRVFQAPNLNDLFYFKESTKSGKRKISHGNKDLRPETGYSQSAGVTWKKRRFHDLYVYVVQEQPSRCHSLEPIQ
jgi:outer membrane receptor protein involved in Fe transport